MREPPTIDSFGAGGFRVSGTWRPGSLLLLDDKAFDWRPTALAEITPADLAVVFEAGSVVSEFILLGTGAEQALPPRSVRDAARGAGLGVEFMRPRRRRGPMASWPRRVGGSPWL